MNTAITLEQAKAKLDALMNATAVDNGALSVRFADRSVTYRTVAELNEQINYWARMVTESSRTKIGVSRHGYAVGDFRRRT